MPDIFEMLNISIENHSICNEQPSTYIENLGLRSKNPVFQIKTFEILGFSHNELEILGILSEMLGISKTWSFV